MTIKKIELWCNLKPCRERYTKNILCLLRDEKNKKNDKCLIDDRL